MMEERMPEAVQQRDRAIILAYMALAVAVLSVALLGFYVYRSGRPMVLIKELRAAQEATASDVEELERALKGLSVNLATIEQTIRRDRNSALLLDLKRSLITLQEVRRQAPDALRDKIEAIEKDMAHLVDEVGRTSPIKRLELKSVR
jgi:hypothetical protein